jgi:hypothetical protein
MLTSQIISYLRNSFVAAVYVGGLLFSNIDLLFHFRRFWVRLGRVWGEMVFPRSIS